MTRQAPQIGALITGAGGLLGRRLAAVPKGYAAYLHYHRRPVDALPDGTFAGNLENPGHVRRVAEQIRPDLIINSAALADVDRCELEPQLSYRANVVAVENLLEVFPDAKFVQISTDYVFCDDEMRGTALPDPEDTPSPVNVYGEHKLKAEQMVRAASADNLIVRVNSLFDYCGRKNIFSHVYESLSTGNKVEGFTDQVSNPIAAASAAGLTWALIENGAAGIFHVGGREVVSRYQFARRIADHFELNNELITVAKSENRRRPARRPVRAGLDCRRTESYLGIGMPGLEDDFTRLREEMNLPSV